MELNGVPHLRCRIGSWLKVKERTQILRIERRQNIGQSQRMLTLGVGPGVIVIVGLGVGSEVVGFGVG